MEWAIAVVMVVIILSPKSSGAGDETNTNTSICIWSECEYKVETDLENIDSVVSPETINRQEGN